MPRWFTRPLAVTHPSTNRARRRVTTLIETNASLLSHATSYACVAGVVCIFQATGGGDGSVRLWHVKLAVNSTQNVHTTWLDTRPPSIQVSGTCCHFSTCQPLMMWFICVVFLQRTFC